MLKTASYFVWLRSLFFLIVIITFKSQWLYFKALADTKHKRDGVAILISDKTDFRTRSIAEDKEEHYMMIFKDQFIKKT